MAKQKTKRLSLSKVLIISNIFVLACNAAGTFFVWRYVGRLESSVRHVQAARTLYEAQSRELGKMLKSRRSDVVSAPQEEWVLLNRDPKHLKKRVLRPENVVEKTESDQLKNEKPAFQLPLDPKCFWISSYFGQRGKGFHYGVDMAAQCGTLVFASRGGVVEHAGNAGSFGKMILIRHDDELKTRYAHLHNVRVSKGKEVCVGDLIGEVGNSGRTRGDNGFHLHFEVLVQGKPVNPMNYITI